MTTKKEALIFGRPDVLREQPQTTFRLGKKWLTEFERGARSVLLADKTGKVFGDGTITEVVYLPLSLVPTAWTRLNADPELRDYESLFADLVKQYPGKVGPDSYVSVLFFTIDTVQ